MDRFRLIIIFILLSTPCLVGQVDTTLKSSIGKRNLEETSFFFPDDSINANVVSASRSNKNPDELPITIYAITRDEILKNQYVSLTDVLKRLPGIRVSQPGSGELGEVFQLRGLIGNMYTKILVNGMPVKPSVVIGMPIMAQLPVRQAERIEVIYGPSAAVYGADAVSGVINIITREADRGTFATGDISLGQNDYLSFDFMVGGKAGRNRNILQYSFYGSKTGFNDMNIKTGYEENYNPLSLPQKRGIQYDIGGQVFDPLALDNKVLYDNGIMPRDFIEEYYPSNYEGDLKLPFMEEMPSESNMLGLDLRFRNFSLSFSNMYRRSHSSLGQSTFLYKYNDPTSFWGENIRRTSISYNKDWTSRFFTTTNYSALSYRMDNSSNESLTFIDYTDKLYRYSAGNDILLEQIVTVIPKNNLEIVAGISYQFSGNLPQTNYLYQPFYPEDYSPFATNVRINDTITGSFGINPLNFHNTSLFAQTYYSINKFRLMAGLRWDNNSIYSSSLSPRIAAIFIPNKKSSIRTSLGFAYKAPSTSLTYQSLAFLAGSRLDSVTYLMMPNRNLEPERYLSVELGFIRKASKRYRYDVSVYYNEIRNLILDEEVPTALLNMPRAYITPEFPYVLVNRNRKDAVSRLYGLQANFIWSDLVKSINLDAELSLTFAKSSDNFPDIVEIAGDFLSEFTLMPNHFGQLHLSMNPVDRLYLSVSGIWESSWLRVILPFPDLYKSIFKQADGYYTMDFLARYSFNNDISIFLKVDNLFDEKYGGIGVSRLNAGLPYNPQLGRNIRFGLSYAWN